MENERDARISPTAHYTAYVWYRLGLPNSEFFATDEGRRLFWGFRLAGEWIAAVSPRLPSMMQYLELRHRLIDGALDEIAPDRVVELGAGLSRRGVTWAGKGVRYIEIDLPHMIREKRRRIDAAGAAVRDLVQDRLVLAPVDVLGEGFHPFLVSALRGAERPLVVAEGVLAYFSIPERRKIAQDIARALRSTGGGIFLADLRSKQGRRAVGVAVRALKAGIRIATRGRGVREDFESPDRIRSFFDEAGFDEAVALDPSSVPHLSGLDTPVSVWRAVVLPQR
jgi:O-methyltransferase involved in polyketide biosynthesis